MEASLVFIKFLQACITPVAMISGVGLLLLTLTNRLGRTIDRTRHLISELENGAFNATEKRKQISILYRRSRILRNSIGWLTVSIISSCCIIPLLFAMNFLPQFDLKIVGYVLFMTSILSLLISSLYFFKDIMITLYAIKLELKGHI